MNIKKALSAAIAIFLFGVVLSPAYAQEQSMNNSLKKTVARTNIQISEKVEAKMMKAQEKMDTMQERTTSRSADLKTRADNEISRRITSLQKLLTKINDFKKVSPDQKTTLTTKVQAEITNLNNLKTKIDADTDQATIKTDVQSIVKSYRVYLLFIPQINIMAGADRINSISDEFMDAFTKIQTKLDEAKAKGTDTTAAEAALADAKAKVTDAKDQANKAVTAISELTPDGYPGNKTTLMEARNMLKTAAADLKAARADLRKVMETLNTKGAVSPVVSISPTATTVSPTP